MRLLPPLIMEANFDIIDSTPIHEVLMKLYIFFFVLIISFSISATTNSNLNLELEKINNSDSNVVFLFKNLDYNLSAAISAYPGKQQFELIKKAINSSACLKMYQVEVSKPIYKVVLDLLEPKFMQFDQLLKKYGEDVNFKAELAQYQKMISLLPKDKICHF